MSSIQHTAATIVFGVALGVSANADAKERGFHSKHEIKEMYLDCLDAADSIDAEHGCVDGRRRHLDEHRAKVGQTRSLYRLRYQKAKMAYRDCKLRRDRQGARRQKEWLRDAKVWWRRFSRFTRYGVTSPGFVPPSPPRSCRPDGRPMGGYDEEDERTPHDTPPPPKTGKDELFEETPPPPAPPPVEVQPGDAPKTPAQPIEEQLPERPSERKGTKEKLPEFTDRELLDLGDPVEKIGTLARQVPAAAVRDTVARTTFVAKVADISLHLQEAMVEPYPALQREMLQSVAEKLDSGLRRTVNGCRSDSEPDGDDWVSDCKWQLAIEEQITIAAGWVRGLEPKTDATPQ